MSLIHRDFVSPLVSVIVPTYNRAWALRRAVESVFSQSYRPIECIIVNDGSTDGTDDLVKALTGECPEGVAVRYFRQENGGANSARNRGLIECRGEFVCYLDSDDLLLPESIAERVRILVADEEVDFCYGLCSVRDEHGAEIRAMNEPWPASGEARVSRYLFDTNSPMIRRSMCTKVGLWREDDSHGQEYEYFARLKYFSNKVVFIDRVLCVYVRHGRGCINNQGSLRFALAIVRVLLAVKALVLYGKYDNPQERRELATEFRKVAKQLYRLRGYSYANAALRESLLLRFDIKVFVQRLVLRGLAISSLSRSKASVTDKVVPD